MSIAEDEKKDSRALAEALANDILVAAGSGGIRHYMPFTKEKIINIAERWVVKLADTKLAP